MFEAFNQLCLSLGAPGLLILAFAAATVVPIGSEWLYVMLLLAAPAAGDQLLLFAVALSGNTAGGLANYWLGRGGQALAHRDLLAQRPRLRAFVERWGAKACLFAFVPWVGDPITVLAGLLRVRPWPFLGYSCLGRGLRYGALWAALLAAGCRTT